MSLPTVRWFPAVWSRVVAGSYRSMAASAAGYARYTVRGETYPGAVAELGAVLQGVVYFDVDAADCAALDQFEGPDYRRIGIAVLGADGNTHAAQTYMYLRHDKLGKVIWKPEEFALREFLDTYCGLAPK